MKAVVASFVCQVDKMYVSQEFFVFNNILITLPKTLILDPKNGGLEDDFPFQAGDFQVPC